MTTLALRAATRDDAAALAALLAEVSPAPTYTAAELEDDLARFPGDDAWVMEAGGELVGWAAFRPRGALLADCGVAARPGHEDALADVLEQRAAERGFPVIRIVPRGPYAGLAARGYVRVRTFSRLRASGPVEAAGPAEIAAAPALDARIHAVEQEAFRSHWGFVPELFAPWRARLERDVDARGFLALLAGEPVGAVRAKRQYGWTWIPSLAVVPSARGRGIGGQLVAAATAGAVGPVGLDVDAENAPALALYRRLGFVEIGHRDFWEKTL